MHEANRQPMSDGHIDSIENANETLNNNTASLQLNNSMQSNSIEQTQKPFQTTSISNASKYRLIEIIKRLDELELADDSIDIKSLCNVLLDSHQRSELKQTLSTQLSDALETQSEQRKTLNNAIANQITIDYHQQSGRFIHSNTDIGKFGLVTTSTFNNEAGDQMQHLINKEVLLASNKRIEKWHSKIAIKDKKAYEQQQLEHIQANSCSGSIGMYTDSFFKQQLDDLATKHKLSMNKLAQQNIDDALNDYKALREHTENSELKAMVVDFVKSSEAAAKGNNNTSSKQKWVLRVPTNIHAAIIFYAQKIELKPANFAKYLIYRSL